MANRDHRWPSLHMAQANAPHGPAAPPASVEGCQTRPISCKDLRLKETAKPLWGDD